MLLIRVCAWVSPLTARVPSHVAEQPPPLGARMKASWKVFCPVACMTARTSGGLLSKGITYGAAPYQLFDTAVVLAASAVTAAVTAAAPKVRVAAAMEPTMNLRRTMFPPRAAGPGETRCGGRTRGRHHDVPVPTVLFW